MASDTSLVFNIIARDRASSQLRRLEDRFRSLNRTMSNVSAMSAILPATAAVATAAAQATSALLGAATATGVFGLALAGQFNYMKDGYKSILLYDTAVRNFGAGSKEANEAAKAMNETLGAMPGATSIAAQQMGWLRVEFQYWSDDLSKFTMVPVIHGLSFLRKLLPHLTPLVKSTSEVFGELMAKLNRKASTPGFAKFMKDMTTWAENGLRKTVDGIGAIVRKIGEFKDSGGLKSFMEYGAQHGPMLANTLMNLANFMGKFIVAAAPIGSLSLTVFSVLAEALNSIPQDVLNVLIPWLLGAATALRTYTLAVEIARNAQRLWNAVMLMNPIGLVIAAIAGLVAAIVLIATKTTWFQTIWKTVWGGIKAAWDAVWGALKTGFNAFLNFFTTTIPNTVRTFLGWFRSTFQTIVGFLTAPLRMAVNIAMSIWNTLKSATSAAWNFIKSTVTTLVNGVRATISSVFNAIRSTIQGVWNAIKSATSAAWNRIKSVVSSVVNAVRNTISSIFSSIRSKILGVWNSAKSATSAAWNWIRSVVSNAARGAWNAVRSAFTNVINKIRSLKGAVIGALTGAGKWLVNAGKAVIRGFVNGIKSAFGWVKSTLSDLTSKLTSWKGPPSKDAVILKSAGQMIIDGFVSGLESRYGVVQKSLSKVTNMVADADKKMAPKVGLGAAKSEALARILKGGSIYEDMSFKGNSKNLAKYNDKVADSFWAAVAEVKKAMKAGKKIFEDYTFVGASKNVSYWNEAMMKIWKSGRNFGDFPGLANGGTVTRSGGILVGEQGPEVMSAKKGATVTPLSRGGSQQITIKFEKSGDSVLDTLLDMVRDKIRVEHGGNVQSALGR